MNAASNATARQHPTPPTRLLFLGHGAERTGPPIILRDLLSGLAAHQPWDLSVLVARGGPLLDDYRRTASRVEVVAAGREPHEPLSALLRRAGQDEVVHRLHESRRRRVARRLPAPDLLYVNAATPPTAALLRAAAPAATVPVVLHVHELDIGLRQTLDPADRRALFARADHLIAVSAPVAEVLVDGHGIDAGRVTVCEGFVDLSRITPAPRARARAELGLPEAAQVVGSVGLPDWRKDPEHLLRAAARLASRPEGPPWVVWIGGDPASPDGRHLADEARRLGLDARFVHVAHHDDPTSLLHALDVFALPAREDALPLAALEAAGAGLPVVCFRTGGTAGLCDDGAGRAVDYPDTAAFADAIGWFLDDPDRRAATGIMGRALIAERHDLDIGVERISTVLSRLLAAGISSGT